jgi:hypothetical protein
MEPKRDEQAKLEAAKEYVLRQLATMKQYGSAPELSPEAFNDLVRQVAQATRQTPSMPRPR